MCSTSSETNVQSPVVNEIKTFVFFSLESIGPIEGHDRTNITEISLVTSLRDALLTTKGRSLPRVMHKLNLPLTPSRQIPPVASKMKGPSDDLQKDEPPFDIYVYEMLNSFLGRLYPPVCFVAHNGDRFDYPILLSELKLIGKSLSEDLLCIDSLDAFETLFFQDDSNCGEDSNLSAPIEEDLNIINDGCDEELAAIVDLCSASSTSGEMERNEVIKEKCKMEPESMQSVNETMPTHQMHSLVNMNQDSSTSSGPVDLKLNTVYQHLVGTAPLESQSAETNCLSLLTCVMKIGDPFMRWADLNARPLAKN